MEAYANDACRTVVAQVTEAVGFQAMTQSTVDTLADVLASYIEEVGYQSHCLTEVSNRTHDNALDTRQALLQCGTTIVDLQRFMGRNELRYAKAEVAFPVQRPPLKASMMLRFGAEQGEHLPHIPDFLPSLPPQHSYKASVKQTGSRAVGSKVTPYHGPPGGPPMKAVHVVGGGVVAALMEPEACPAVPEAMRRLLADGDVAFVPGIRVNSAVCAAVG